ncbi:hypothetical protein [Ulvibacter antarcticus]|uniref:Carboxypeptidase family protein n=1 Tax=Ulvibacter antarcticus TaxID=442714 RepID=A0A3L9YXK0_9FLAO|nr:hypothetical protein [Ulvibacter antarcticus]RMA64557.1 hypothetical protein BXY75_1433 [Ulvibacter antarcticus]
MKKASVILVLFFLNLGLYAQLPASEVVSGSQVFPKENIKLSSNANILLAGETLLYKGYCRTNANSASTLSKILYVSLRNAKDSIVFQHKLKLENGAANGYFFIPASLKTGVYELIGYTNFSRNNKQDVFDHSTIHIINPFLTPANITQSGNELHKILIDTTPQGLSEVLNNDVNGLFQKIKSNYPKRSKVELSTLNSANSIVNGDYLLSVRKLPPLTIQSTEGLSNTTDTSSNTFFIPELRGELISGVVTDINNGQAVADKMVSLTIPGQNYVSKLAKTNKNGRFFFSVDEYYLTSKATFQIKENDRKQYKISLDDKTFASEELRTNRELLLDKSMKQWIEDRSIALQIQNAYYNANNDSLEVQVPNPRFFGKLGTTYLLDDYTRFPTVKETFIEVIKLAAVRGSGKESKFIVFDEYNYSEKGLFSELPALLLMDGMLIQNNDELLAYDARNIHSIRVIAEAYRFGPQIYSGIIAINTKKGDFVSSMGGDFMASIPLDQPLPRKHFYTPNYEKESLDRIPDNRVQLIWQPNVRITGDESLSFYTSDETGAYEIVLEGYSSEGKFTRNVAYFKVE